MPESWINLGRHGAVALRLGKSVLTRSQQISCKCRGKERRDLKPWEQQKDVVPDSVFVGYEVFEERLRAYLKRSDSRRRLSKDDMMLVDG